MGLNVDMEEAIQKATDFLGEHHTTISLISSEFVDNTWVILFDVGFLSNQLKEVKVDADSGKIMGYISVESDEDD